MALNINAEFRKPRRYLVDAGLAALAPIAHLLIGGALFRPWVGGIDASIYLALSNNSEGLLKAFPSTYYTRRFVAYLPMGFSQNLLGLHTGYLVSHAICYATPIYLILRIGRLISREYASRIAVLVLVCTYWYGNMFTSDYTIFAGVSIASFAALFVVESPRSNRAWGLAGLCSVLAVSAYPSIGPLTAPYVFAAVCVMLLDRTTAPIRRLTPIIAFTVGITVGVTAVEMIWRFWSDTGTNYWPIILSTARDLLIEGGARAWFVSVVDAVSSKPHVLLPAIFSTVSIVISMYSTFRPMNNRTELKRLNQFVVLTNLATWMSIAILYRQGSGIVGLDYGLDPVVMLVAINVMHILVLSENALLVNGLTPKETKMLLGLAVVPWLIIEILNPRSSFQAVVLLFFLLNCTVLILFRVVRPPFCNHAHVMAVTTTVTALLAVSVSLIASDVQFERRTGFADSKSFKNRSVVVEFQNWVNEIGDNNRILFWYDASDALMTISQSAFFRGYTIATFQSSPVSPRPEVVSDKALLENAQGSEFLIAMASEQKSLRDGIREICPGILEESEESPVFFGYDGHFSAIAFRSRVLVSCLEEFQQ